MGGLALKEASARNLPEYEVYGQAMLTTAVFAVVITAPLGAIMINTLGEKWLEYDGDDPAELAKHGLPPRVKDDQEAVELAAVGDEVRVKDVSQDGSEDETPSKIIVQTAGDPAKHVGKTNAVQPMPLDATEISLKPSTHVLVSEGSERNANSLI